MSKELKKRTNEKEKIIVLMIVDGNSNFISKELIYTGITRAKKKLFIFLGTIVLVVVLGLPFLLKKDNVINKDTDTKKVTSVYRMSGYSLEAFDLYFLNSEDNKNNMVYSPLSIKYALEMLHDGSSGNSKAQLGAIIGDYEAKKYLNSANMSFANALFIQDESKNAIKNNYINTLNNKYNASIIYDSFNSPDNINKWISDKTLGLLKDVVDDVKDKDFLLVNALGIDMEWKNVIQPVPEKEPYDKLHSDFDGEFIVTYPHEKEAIDPITYYVEVGLLDSDYFPTINFNGKDSKGLMFAASINNYDIINTLGKENIENNIRKEYEKFVAADTCGEASYESTDKVVSKYMSELGANYKDVASSTDFRYLDNEDVKVFAKELKEYNNTTFEYVAIMPKEKELADYIKNVNVKDINKVISDLVPITLEASEKNVITKIEGMLPIFKFDYDLNLQKDLETLGVKDIFDIDKADLSNLTTMQKTYISEVKHKANIEFSNEGIKASASTIVGGKGDIGCEFDYLYEVPVKTIDLNFDKPFMFIIRDKYTGEVWFAGSVYEGIAQDLHMK